MTLINDKNYNRDLSWLRFNHRVLQEAADSRNPLYERIKFLAIYSSNLDEFFKVRVSDIRQIKSLNKKLRKKLITNPNKLLKEIKEQVDLQGDELGEIFGNQILPELKNIGIDLISYSEFDNKQKEFAVDYFKKQLKAKVNIKKSFHAKEAHLYVENEKLYLVSLNVNK
jgi:polyphosphate kinase